MYPLGYETNDVEILLFPLPISCFDPIIIFHLYIFCSNTCLLINVVSSGTPALYTNHFIFIFFLFLFRVYAIYFYIGLAWLGLLLAVVV